MSVLKCSIIYLLIVLHFLEMSPLILCFVLGFLFGRKSASKRLVKLTLLFLVPLVVSLLSCFIFLKVEKDLTPVQMTLPLSYPFYLKVQQSPIDIYPPSFSVKVFFVTELYRFNEQTVNVYYLTAKFLPIFYILNLASIVVGYKLASVSLKAKIHS